MFLQPIYFPIAEYGKQRGNTALDALVTSPTYQPAGRKPLGYLDVSVTYNKAAHAVYVNVLNRSSKMDIATRVDSVEGAFGSAASIWEMNYDDMNATKVSPASRTATLSLAGKGFDYTFPKHSLTILKLQLQ